MDGVIQELIALDQRARATVGQAETGRDAVKKKIAQEKAELHQRYLERAQRRIEKVRQAALEDSERQKAEIEREGESARQELGRRFDANRVVWTDEIVSRCLRPGLTREEG